MPHDANDQPLKVGDNVYIPAKITSITESADYCNCSVELEYPMPPENTKSSFSSLNTRQVVLSPIQEGASGSD